MKTTDQSLGDKGSTLLYEAAKKTWSNRLCRLGEVIQPNDSFSGVRFCRLRDVRTTVNPELAVGLCFDGVGSKIEVAERMDKWDTLAFDLFAMVCDDAVSVGAEPALLGTVLDVSSIQLSKLEQLIKGYIAAAKEARVAVVNGELAQLGYRIQGFGSYNVNWNAGCLWFADPDRLFNLELIQPGDILIGLQETGCRSNGFTLLKSALQSHFGGNWHRKSIEGETVGELALQPSKIYTPGIVDVVYPGKANTTIHGCVNITGGGIPFKLGRLLKKLNLGADITNPYKPGKLFAYLMNRNVVEERVAYENWNMGQGMIVITSPTGAEGFMKQIHCHHSIRSQIIGEIKEQNTIRVFGVQGVYTWECLT